MMPTVILWWTWWDSIAKFRSAALQHLHQQQPPPCQQALMDQFHRPKRTKLNKRNNFPHNTMVVDTVKGIALLICSWTSTARCWIEDTNIWEHSSRSQNVCQRLWSSIKPNKHRTWMALLNSKNRPELIIYAPTSVNTWIIIDFKKIILQSTLAPALASAALVVVSVVV